MWNPWRGCHKCSEGCRYCYIHKGDQRRNIDTDKVTKTDQFDLPIRKQKNGEYKIKSGQTVYLCFSADFLVEDADDWRQECWQMMKERTDLTFLFLTKRIERFKDCMPADWGAGYENVIIGCTIENQKNADMRLAIFSKLPIKHKCIIAQPLIEKINLEKYLQDIELVVVGGESDKNARPLNYDWVLNIREACVNKNISFEFRQCGTHFIKGGKEYFIPTRELIKQAKKAKIDYNKVPEKVLRDLK